MDFKTNNKANLAKNLSVSDKSARACVRKAKRLARKNLSAKQQLQASKNLASNINKFLQFKNYKKFALYLANDGEIDLNFWLENLPQKMQKTRVKTRQARFAANINFYLPSLHKLNYGKMRFANYDKQTRLQKNRFKIKQPVDNLGFNFNFMQLDVIFMPLVAFDAACNRLGMGGGFYDKTLARLNSPHFHKPKLIGIAHSLQEVASLPIADWDFPLDAVITDKKIFIRFS